MKKGIKLFLILILFLLLTGCHKHEYSETKVEATCEEAGFTLYECECGESYYDTITNPKGHKLQVVDGKEAICKEDGYTTEIKCLDCNKIIQAKEIIKKSEHKFNEWSSLYITEDKTHEVLVSYCEKCNLSQYKIVTHDVHTHKYENIKFEETEDGKLVVKLYCECGEFETQEIKIPVTHAYGEWEVVKEATETEKGLKQKECLKCKDIITEEIPTLEHTHNFIETKYEPTCINNGYTNYKCACGKEYNDNYTNPLGHNYSEWKVVKEATETEVGLKQKECLTCKDVIKEDVQTIEHAHKFIETVVKATCLNNGYTNYKCGCGKEYNDNYTNLIDHNYSEWEIIKEATELETGSKKKKCVNCNVEIVEIIPLKEHIHQYEETIIAPTCTEKGYTVYTCACGETYNDNYIDSLGHSLQELEIIEEAICNKDGKGKQECEVCDYVLEVVIPMTNIHTEKLDTVLQEPTCTEDGIGKYICEVCNITLKYQLIPAGHKIEALEIYVPATCIEAGIAKYGCINCGEETYYKVIEAHHEYGLIEIVKEPTNEVAGVAKYGCVNCGEGAHYISIESLKTPEE